MPKVVKQQPNALRPGAPGAGKPTASTAMQPKLVRPAGAKASILDRIAPIGFSEAAGIKINIYGQSATGKTTTWATFPKPILAVVCSGMAATGELRSIDTPEYRETVNQVVLHSSQELAELANILQDEDRKENQPYATVVLDHATGLQDLVLKEVLGLEQLPVQKGWGTASQQQWGTCAQQCKELLRALLGLSSNIVIVAQERTFGGGEEDSEVIRPTVGSALSPSLAGWLFPTVDYIVQTFKRQKEVLKTTVLKQGGKTKSITQRIKTKGVDYCLRTGPDPVYTTKFRVPRGYTLPDSVIDPSYDKIMALLRGEPLPTDGIAAAYEAPADEDNQPDEE